MKPPSLAATSPTPHHGTANASGLPPQLLLLFAATAWGASFVAARAVLAAPEGLTSLSPLLLATVRFAIASGVFAPVLVRQRLRQRLRRQSSRVARSDLPVFALLGQLGISLYFFLQYTGVRLTNAGVASVLVVGGIPLATLAVSAAVLHEPLDWRKSLGLAGGAIGVFVVAAQRGLTFAAGRGFLIGAACLVLDALCFAVYSTLVRRMRARYDPVTITAMTTLWGTAGLAAVAAVTEDWSTLGNLTPGQWGAVLYLSIACSVLAYLAYNSALARVAAARAATWIYLETPVAIVLGALLLDETVTLQTLAGAAMILLSLYLVERHGRGGLSRGA